MARVVREGGGLAWRLVEIAGVLIGLSISTLLAFGFDAPTWGIAALAATVVLIVVEGGFRLHRREQLQHLAALGELEARQQQRVTQLEHERSQALAERDAAREELDHTTATFVEELVEGELLAIIEEGAALNPGLTGPQFGAYKVWCEKTATFIGTVYGPAERQRFAEAPEQPSAALTDELAGRLARLRALRDMPKPWPLQADARDVLRAAEQRRTLSEAERIVMAAHPDAGQPSTPGRSPFPRSPLEGAVAESAIAAEDLRREAAVRGTGSLLDAITKWAGETDQRLEHADAGDLRAELSADGIPEPAETDAQLAYLDRQIRRLRRAWRDLRRDEMTPLELLQERYDLGRDLQHTLPWLTGSTETPEELREADKRAERLACQWAEETWRMLRHHFPGHERAFYGPDDPALGLFTLACQHEIAQLGTVAKYLAAKLDLLADLLRAHGQ